MEAEKAEQQRIKALVLNYDLTSTPTGDSPSDGANGDYQPFHLPSLDLPPLQPNINHTTNRLVKRQAKFEAGLPEKPLVQPPITSREQGSRKEKDASDQNAKGSGLGSKRQQARKLQMSDVDWYGSCPMVDDSEHGHAMSGDNGYHRSRPRPDAQLRSVNLSP